MANTRQDAPEENHVLMLDWQLDVDNLERDCLKVLERVRPAWDQGNIKFRTFSDGITNRLLGCYDKTKPKDVVLIRVNGEGTDEIIDRKAEAKTFQLLSAAKCAPPLYALLRNGIAYGFFHGQPLDEELVRDDKVGSLIAQEIVRMQKITPSPEGGSERRSAYQAKVQSYLNTAPTAFTDPAKHDKLVKLIPSKASLQMELNEICAQLEALKMPVVFAHNDLLLKNIVYDENEGVIRFIDYEYSFPNYQAFDIGNHFAEYAGMDEVNYDLYPDKTYQLKWLRRYLHFDFIAKGRSPQDITDTDVERLYVQAAHFFWGLWALIQAKNSTIDFDYVEYAVTRLNEYFRRKKEFFPLSLP